LNSFQNLEAKINKTLPAAGALIAAGMRENIKS